MQSSKDPKPQAYLPFSPEGASAIMAYLGQNEGPSLSILITHIFNSRTLMANAGSKSLADTMVCTLNMYYETAKHTLVNAKDYEALLPALLECHTLRGHKWDFGSFCIKEERATWYLRLLIEMQKKTDPENIFKLLNNRARVYDHTFSTAIAKQGSLTDLRLFIILLLELKNSLPDFDHKMEIALLETGQMREGKNQSFVFLAACYQSKQILLELIESNILPAHHWGKEKNLKEKIFAHIKTLPQEEQKRFFIKALAKDEPLNDFFSTQRGQKKPRIEKGFLNKIYLELKKLGIELEKQKRVSYLLDRSSPFYHSQELDNKKGKEKEEEVKRISYEL